MLVTRNNFAEVMPILEAYNEVAVDLETTGLIPWNNKYKSEICGIAIFNGIESFYFSVGHLNSENISEAQLQGLLFYLSSRKRLRNHNIKFDINFLRRMGLGRVPPVVDSMFGLYLYNECGSLGLKPGSEKHLDSDSSREQRELRDLLNQWGYGPAEMWKLPASLVAAYAEKDTRLTWALTDALRLKLGPKLNELWDEMNQLSSIVQKMEERGIYVNPEVLEKLEREAQVNVTDLFIKIQIASNRRCDPSSPASIARWLGLPDAKEETLLAYAKRSNDKNVDLILKFKWWTKGINTYYKPYRSEWSDDKNIIHTSLNICGTLSGRFSSSSPNLQQVPRYSEEQKIKDVFCARENHTFVEIDYSQAEIKLAAHYTQEADLIKALWDGKDIHQTVADLAKVTRQTAKTINFAMIYGAGAKRLAEQLAIPVKEAQKFLDQYNSTFPGYKQTSRHAQKTAEERGYVVLWNGRRRHYGEGSEPHTAFNQIIQGGVAQMVNTTMINIDKMFSPNILLQVHDALYFEVPNNELEIFCIEVKKEMQNQPQFSVPMTVDIKTGKSLGSMKKYEVSK
jgi:DNA polymerase-1